jgi:hypothetical protein
MSETEWKTAEKKPVEVMFREVTEREEIRTREGTVVAEPGEDYVIRGIEDEIYPISKDIFHKTYRVIE